MRVTIVFLIILLISRMIYDLTWNPLEAFANMLGCHISHKTAVIRGVGLITFFIVFVTIWTLVMPSLLAYGNQPYQTDTHILGQMPMYGNEYVEARDHLLCSETYRYMTSDATTYAETKKGTKVLFTHSENSDSRIDIKYQLPKVKTLGYFFMDEFSWPKERKEREYVFYLIYH